MQDPGHATGYLTANWTGGAVRSLHARRTKSRSKVSTRADPCDEAAIIASPKSIPPLYQDTARSVTARSSIETRCRLSKASSARRGNAAGPPRRSDQRGRHVDGTLRPPSNGPGRFRHLPDRSGQAFQEPLPAMTGSPITGHGAMPWFTFGWTKCILRKHDPSTLLAAENRTSLARNPIA